MNRSPADYLDLPYHITLVHDSGEGGPPGWIASVEEFPGCLSQGDSPDEAVALIREAMELWIEGMVEEGLAVPEPRDETAHSGRFVVRMPSGLHRSLEAAAKRDGVSLNQMAVALIAGGLGWRPASNDTSHDRRRSA